MSLSSMLGRTNVKKVTLPPDIKLRIAMYVKSIEKPKFDDFYFWAYVNLTYVKPRGIHLFNIQLKRIYMNEISNETWEKTGLDITSEETPRLNSTPILTGMLNPSQINDIVVAHELYVTDAERVAEMKKLTERFCSNGTIVLTCELFQLYKDLKESEDQFCATEFKMQYQELPLIFSRANQHTKEEFSEEVMPADIFKGEKFAILNQNKDWITMTDIRTLEYLILLYGGKIDYLEAERSSMNVIPLWVARSSEAIDQFFRKYKYIFSKQLVIMSIKNGTYNKLNNCQYLIRNTEEIPQD